ncbi:ALF repeat-containing protein [Kribbella sp. NPDC050281]|uniref:ALF repeat-containing protein n=1 Tax=Kribbella sp. NPDC050281 TaxID=3155515 RepID=UPI0033D1E1A9
MRRTKVALAVAAIALTPALLITTPASAADSVGAPTACQAPTDTFVVTTPVDEMSDDDVRVTILRIIGDPSTGSAVEAAAQKAMDGTIEDQRNFLTTDRWTAQAEDDKVAVATTLHFAIVYNDRGVSKAAQQALNDGTPTVVRAFLETGCRLAQFEDDRVAIFRILADPTTSAAVRAAAEQALDEGTPEAARYFLEHGQFEV